MSRIRFNKCYTAIFILILSVNVIFLYIAMYQIRNRTDTKGLALVERHLQQDMVDSNPSASPGRDPGPGTSDEDDGRMVVGDEGDGRMVVVIQEFETYQHHLVEMTQNILHIDQDIKVIIIRDEPFYPPIAFADNVEQVTLQSGLRETNKFIRVYNLIKSIKYILILPDGVLLSSKRQVDQFMKIYTKSKAKILVSSSTVKDRDRDSDSAANIVCNRLSYDYKKWTLQFNSSIDNVNCDAIKQDDIILMETQDWLNLAEPFARPVFISLALQAHVKVLLHRTNKINFKRLKLFSSQVNLWQHKSNQANRLRNFYRKFGIKKIEHVSLDNTVKTEWLGCTKDTSRCFDTILNDTPQYIYSGRWTPPCCLRALRETARHVFGVLDRSKVRFWLEGGSLLGAARHNDIIPWDYDVDIGIYRDDLKKCDLLKKVELSPLIDEDGFLWEKAKEGQFYRVQYSESNHMHVDIFPFYSKNATMTKDTWIASHRQDREFPETYLKPLERIEFAGTKAYAPNHMREFLELKFGRGVIETPQYPNPQLIKNMNQRPHS